MVGQKTDNRCKWCDGEVAAAARYCSNCRTFSGWRGWFGAAERTVGLLVTLISVLGLIASIFASYIFPERARLFAALKPLDSSTVEVQLTNIGKVQAFSYGFFSCKDLGPSGETRLLIDYTTPLAVSPGATVKESFTLVDGSSRLGPLSADMALALLDSQTITPAVDAELTLLCEGYAFDEVGLLEIAIPEPYVTLKWIGRLTLNFFMMQPD